MASTSLIAAAAASRIPLLRGYGPAMISVIVVISTFGGLVGSMMTGPRVVFAMADRGLLFKSVARISPRYATPSIAIAISTTLAITYTLLNDFAHLVDKFILGSWPFYALAVAATFTLRRRRPNLARPYRTWGYPYVPTLFLVASALMVANALRVDPINTAITFGIVLTGLPIYWFWNRGSLRRNTRP
jgi:amino acid transporter